MVWIPREMVKRHGELMHDSVVEIWFHLMPSLGPQDLRRQFFDAVLVVAKHHIGAAIREALTKRDREDEDAIRRMEWEGCPHGGDS